MKFIVILLFIPMFSRSQTCIVIKRYKNYIICGADSRQIKPFVHSLKNRPDTIISSVCKIVRVGNIYYAYAGLTTDTLKNIVAKCISDGGSIDSISENCRKSVVKELTYTLYDEIKLIGETKFYTEHPLNTIICGYYIFGYLNNQFEVRNLSFYIKKDGIASDYKAIGSEDAIGHTFEIKRDRLLHNGLTWANGGIKGIRKLIGYEIKFHPNNVAEPIDIIKILKHKSVWISKKQECY